jgi:hypothetical protein
VPQHFGDELCRAALIRANLDDRLRRRHRGHRLPQRIQTIEVKVGVAFVVNPNSDFAESVEPATRSSSRRQARRHSL